MIYCLRGRIIDRTPATVAIDLGNIGYEVFVPRPQEFLLGEEALIYVEEVFTQDDHYLAGFSNKLEKEAFLALTKVKGIGAKTALSALSGTNPESLFNAIESGDAKALKKLPGIGPKAASQIILDLKGKLVEEEPKEKKSDRYKTVQIALKSLGFKQKEIDMAISSIDKDDLTDDEALRRALQKLRKDN